MNSTGARALSAAEALTFITAVAQLACIAISVSADRFMGAGERMARKLDARESLIYPRPAQLRGGCSVATL